METHTLDWASVFPYVRFVSRSGVPGNAKDVRRQEVFLSSYICALTNYQFDFQNLSPQCNLFFKVVGSIKFSPLSLRSSPRSYAGRPEFWKKKTSVESSLAYSVFQWGNVSWQTMRSIPPRHIHGCTVRCMYKEDEERKGNTGKNASGLRTICLLVSSDCVMTLEVLSQCEEAHDACYL